MASLNQQQMQNGSILKGQLHHIESNLMELKKKEQYLKEKMLLLTNLRNFKMKQEKNKMIIKNQVKKLGNNQSLSEKLSSKNGILHSKISKFNPLQKCQLMTQSNSLKTKDNYSDKISCQTKNNLQQCFGIVNQNQQALFVQKPQISSQNQIQQMPIIQKPIEKPLIQHPINNYSVQQNNNQQLLSEPKQQEAKQPFEKKVSENNISQINKDQSSNIQPKQVIGEQQLLSSNNNKVVENEKESTSKQTIQNDKIELFEITDDQEENIIAAESIKDLLYERDEFFNHRPNFNKGIINLIDQF